jgi:hypothetical protein
MNAKFCYARSQNCEKRQLASSCLSDRPNGTTGLPVHKLREINASVFSKNLWRKFKFH